MRKTEGSWTNPSDDSFVEFPVKHLPTLVHHHTTHMCHFFGEILFREKIGHSIAEAATLMSEVVHNPKFAMKVHDAVTSEDSDPTALNSNPLSLDEALDLGENCKHMSECMRNLCVNVGRPFEEMAEFLNDQAEIIKDASGADDAASSE